MNWYKKSQNTPSNDWTKEEIKDDQTTEEMKNEWITKELDMIQPVAARAVLNMIKNYQLGTDAWIDDIYEEASKDKYLRKRHPSLMRRVIKGLIEKGYITEGGSIRMMESRSEFGRLRLTEKGKNA